jgi:hypothetical protein
MTCVISGDFDHEDSSTFYCGVYEEEEKCSCGKPGEERTDNGLKCGIHCDECWIDLIVDSRKRAW